MLRRRVARGCLWFVAILLALVGIAIVVAWYQGRQTPDGQPEYVALGSSFAAGAGLGSLQKGAPLLCARSINGYPQKLARMRALSIVDMSCGGAVTKNLVDGGQFFQGPQIRTINTQTRLVTITVGGNDVGYVGDLSMMAARHTTTVFGRLAHTFWSGPSTLAQRDYPGLRRELVATLQAIKKAAPNAIIVVATYPTILPPRGTCARIGLTDAEATLMREVGTQLAATTKSAASQLGVTVVDMDALGVDHNACSANPWTNGWQNAGAAPFHPTELGAEATANAISEALR